MFRHTHGFAVLFISACLPLSVVFGQFGGSRAGLEEKSCGVPDLPHLDREVAESYITIGGRAEIRGAADRNPRGFGGNERG